MLVTLCFSISCQHSQTNNKRRVETTGSYLMLEGQRVPADKFKEKMKSEKAVEIFYQKDPSGEILEVGIVEAVAYGVDTSLQDLIPELQNQAQWLNADGVYKVQINRYNHNGPALHSTGVAFVYKDKK
jgi:hypothetical protein